MKTLLLAATALTVMAGAANARPTATQERDQTRALNLEQAQMAQPVSQAHDSAANLPANAPPAAAPTVTAQASALPQAQFALSEMKNPPDKIATASVIDSSGTPLGAVQKVDVQNGVATRVEVALLGNEKMVSLNPAQLSYDPANNILTAGTGALAAAQ